MQVVWSGKVDVVGKALLSGPSKKGLHACNFGVPCAPPHKDHDARIFARWSQCYKVVPVARDKDGSMVVRPSEDLGIGRVHRQCLPQANDCVAAMPKPVCHVVRHVLIEEEGHTFGSCI